MDAADIVRLVENHILNQSGQTTAPPATPLTWQQVKYAAGWADLGGVYAIAAYAKDSNGMVHLRGVANYASGSGANSPIATLPPGFCPPAAVVFPVLANGALARLDITPAGVVSISGLPGTSTWAALSGIYFPTT